MQRFQKCQYGKTRLFKTIKVSLHGCEFRKPKTTKKMSTGSVVLFEVLLPSFVLFQCHVLVHYCFWLNLNIGSAVVCVVQWTILFNSVNEMTEIDQLKLIR
jgi:hypothetical protein